MKRLLFLICAIAIFTTGYVSAACAHIDEAQQIEKTLTDDHSGNAPDTCDMHHCCHVHVVSSYVSDQGILLHADGAGYAFLDGKNLSSITYDINHPPII